MEKRELAFNLYKESKGVKPLVEIAEEVNASAGTVRGWKSRYKWDELIGKSPPETKRNVAKKKRSATRNVTEKDETLVKVPGTEIEDITDINEYYGISEQQRRFADFYIEEPNIYQSAVKAGYSEEYARARSYKLSENVGIRKYMNDRLRVLASGQIATQEDVMRHLTNVMFRREKENQVVTLRSKEEKWVPVSDGKTTTLKKQMIETEVPQIVEFPTKISDTNKAAELIGKRYALFTDKVDVSVIEPPVFEDDISGEDDG